MTTAQREALIERAARSLYEHTTRSMKDWEHQPRGSLAVKHFRRVAEAVLRDLDCIS